MNLNKGLAKKIPLKVIIKIISRILLFFIFMGLLFFLSAGSLKYWEVWAYFITLIVPAIFVITYFLRKDPGLLERRILRRREKEKEHKSIQNIFSIIFLAGLLIPGLDYRYQWSDVPYYIVIISDIFVLAGYLIIVRVMKENSFATAIIETQEDQKVIDTGPYKVVRHPMYTGGMIFFLFTPPALGSYWALIPFLVIIPTALVLRIKGEEKLLLATLPGYSDYCQKTKYHLIPFIW
ncbi:MAG: hypothetical protein AMS27_14500 [Bacteroides sp. SM23_62_1]|nr:MAG: hypothetical protein AMS27_14500 [Bacteroides sp. SM23_62_1]